MWSGDQIQPHQPLSVAADMSESSLDGSAPVDLFDNYDKGEVLNTVKFC